MPRRGAAQWERSRAGEQAAFQEWLSSTKIVGRLNRLLGGWEDEQHSVYKLSLGLEDGEIDVETRRPSGQTIKSRGLIRIDWWETCGRIVWGKGGGRSVYVLTSLDQDSIEWSRDGSKSFRWSRTSVELDEEQDSEDWEEEPETALGDGTRTRWSRGAKVAPLQDKTGRNDAAEARRKLQAELRADKEARRKKKQAQRQSEASDEEETIDLAPSDLLSTRVDPQTKRLWTFYEFRDRYSSSYSKKDLIRYWKNECKPANESACRSKSPKRSALRSLSPKGCDPKEPSLRCSQNNDSRKARGDVVELKEALHQVLANVAPQKADAPEVPGSARRHSTVKTRDAEEVRAPETHVPEASAVATADIGQRCVRVAEEKGDAQGIRTPEPELPVEKRISPEYVAALEAKIEQLKKTNDELLQQGGYAQSSQMSAAPAGPSTGWGGAYNWGWPTNAWPADVQEITSTMNYYFSDSNLAKDAYLRSIMMPDEGWVSLPLLQNFPRMKQFGATPMSVCQAVCNSAMLELDGTQCYVRIKDKQRRLIWTPKSSDLVKLQ